MSRRSANAALLLCALACGYAQAALAERADRNKPIHITADRVMLDDAKQMGVFSGDVLMTQGTLSVSGDQIVVTQGKRGLQQGVATGNPAKFRQKQDGVNEFVEGSGDRIEYNAVTGIMDIYGHAHVRRGQDDVRGDHITYNAHDQSFQATGARTKPRRIIITIGPRPPASAPPPAAEPLPIRPETRLIKPDDNK